MVIVQDYKMSDAEKLDKIYEHIATCEGNVEKLFESQPLFYRVWRVLNKKKYLDYNERLRSLYKNLESIELISGGDED